MTNVIQDQISHQFVWPTWHCFVTKFGAILLSLFSPYMLSLTESASVGAFTSSWNVPAHCACKEEGTAFDMQIWQLVPMLHWQQAMPQRVFSYHIHSVWSIVPNATHVNVHQACRINLPSYAMAGTRGLRWQCQNPGGLSVYIKCWWSALKTTTQTYNILSEIHHSHTCGVNFWYYSYNNGMIGLMVGTSGG